jgi:hypothetical protein
MRNRGNGHMAIYNKDFDNLRVSSDVGWSDAAAAGAGMGANDVPSPDRAAVSADFRLINEIAVKGCRNKGITKAKLAVCGVGQRLVSKDDGTVRGEPLPMKVSHFDVGDHQAMADYAVTLSQEPGYNVCRSLAVYGASLGSKGRGKLEDIVFCIGVVGDMDADKGSTTRVEDLPPPL